MYVHKYLFNQPFAVCFFLGMNYALQYDMRAHHILLRLSFGRFIHSEQHDTKLVCTFQSVLLVAV